MAAGRLFWGAMAGVAAICAQAPAQARQDTGAVKPSEAAVEADAMTDAQLLMALVGRRFEIAQAAGDNRPALAFLDRQIAQLRSRVAESRKP